mgnify:CR=1 FL=1
MQKPVLFLDFDGPLFPERVIGMSKPISAYDTMKAELYADPNLTADDAYGDPKATTDAILKCF